MADLRQAAQMALEALEFAYGGEALEMKERAAIDALRAAISAVQEPVAYGFPNTAITGRNRWMMLRENVPPDDQYGGALWVPLYTHPAPTAQPVMPAGWKLVPVEPTPEMLFDGANALPEGRRFQALSFDVYRAMLAAAPNAPTAQPLTDEQIENLCAEACALASEAGDLDLQPIHLARAIERAHGIGG